MTITEFLGRFHPLLVHLPIGILLMALLLQWLSKKNHFKMPSPLTRLIWWTGIIAALLSCITGYLLSLTETYDEDTVTIHMWMGIGVAAISLLLASKIFKKEFDWVYREYDYAVFPMTIHPDVSGRPHVLMMLERLYHHMIGHPGVRFVTMNEMADDFAKRFPRKK